MNLNVKPIRFHDLEAFQFADGTIRLSQQAGIDEPSVIDLHPAQVEFLADKFGGSRQRELERRLAVLTDKLQDVVCDQYFRSDILERCGDGLYMLAKLDAVVDLALEFDGGRLKPEEGIPEPKSTEPKTDSGKSFWEQPAQSAAPPEPPASDDGQLGLKL